MLVSTRLVHNRKSRQTTFCTLAGQRQIIPIPEWDVILDHGPKNMNMCFLLLNLLSSCAGPHNLYPGDLYSTFEGSCM